MLIVVKKVAAKYKELYNSVPTGDAYNYFVCQVAKDKVNYNEIIEFKIDNF